MLLLIPTLLGRPSLLSCPQGRRCADAVRVLVPATSLHRVKNMTFDRSSMAYQESRVRPVTSSLHVEL